MPERMCLRESPPPFSPGVTGMNTLVAITASSRLKNLGPASRWPPRWPRRVGVGGVEEGHPAFDRGPHDRLRRILVDDPGPVAVVAEPHHAQADPGNPQARRSQIDVVHC